MSKKKAPTSIPCELPLALDPSVSARPPDRPVASQSSARPPFPAASAAAAAPAAAPAVRSLVANSSGMDTRFDEDERTTAATRRRQSPSPSFAPSTSKATAVGLTRYGAVKSSGPRRELETGETSRCMEVLLLENPIDATKPSPLHVDEDKQGEVIGGTQQNAPESCVTERARLNLKSRSSAVGQSAGSPLKERILAPSTAMKRATENKYLANLKTDIVEKALKYDRKEKMKEVIHEADDIPEEGFVLEPTGHGNGKQFPTLIRKKKLGGALCDEMGMGKTRQVAAFLRGLLQADVIHNAMIICPVTVIETWRKELNIVGVLDGGVLITTFEAVRDHIHRILEAGGTAWDYIVIDEAHRMKNDRTKLFDSLCRIDCTHRILMTGMLIQNNLTEFYALMNFCCPNLPGESGQFHENFSMPIERARYRGASAQLIKESIEASERLKKLVSPFVLRRTKDMLKNSASKLGTKHELTVWLKISAAQEYLYTNLIMSNVLGDEPGTPLAASQVARSICNHPVMVIGSDFEQRGESEEKKDALTDIIRKGLLAVSNIEDIEVGDYSLSSKEFQQTNRWSLFLITTNVGGVGITLTKATRVIVFDPAKNPSNDTQSVDRAHRLGQDKDVIVYRLVTCGTIEEHTYRQQVIKGEKATAVMKENQSRREITKPTRRVLSMPPEGFGVSKTLIELLAIHGGAFDPSLDESEIRQVRGHESVVGVSNHLHLFSQRESDPPVDAEILKSIRSTFIEIPIQQVGCFVGEKGGNIMKLENISGAKIHRLGVDSYTHMQLYKISGTPHQISKAENLVKEFLQEMDSMVEEEISVPMEKVGLVIGSGGATIKKYKNLHPRSESGTTGRFVIRGSQNQTKEYSGV
uniref:Helicase ATP-binding domain-containing protein n=1 Tax=Oryza nivara TaxID=4536 RepID=A0A0E0IWM3_ORYNI